MPLCINSRDGILFFVPDVTIIHERNQARSHPNLYGKWDSIPTTTREKLIYHTPSQPKPPSEKAWTDRHLHLLGIQAH